MFIPTAETDFSGHLRMLGILAIVRLESPPFFQEIRAEQVNLETQPANNNWILSMK